MTKQTKFQKQILALAKAMEQGCKKTRPVRGVYLRPASRGAPYACALGAAFVNGNSVESSVGQLVTRRIVAKRQPVIEVCSLSDMIPLGSEIVTRNDEKKYSRLRVVAWLRRVAKLSTPPQQWSDVK